jgi:hypothetical protein
MSKHRIKFKVAVLRRGRGRRPGGHLRPRYPGCHCRRRAALARMTLLAGPDNSPKILHRVKFRGGVAPLAAAAPGRHSDAARSQGRRLRHATATTLWPQRAPRKPVDSLSAPRLPWAARKRKSTPWIPCDVQAAGTRRRAPCRRANEGLGGRGPGGVEAALWRCEMRGRHFRMTVGRDCSAQITFCRLLRCTRERPLMG